MPGKFRKISNEEKTAVMTAIKPLLDQGWTLHSAYNQVKADFQSEEKTIPAEMTIKRWFAGNANTQTHTDPHGRTQTDAGADETARDHRSADAETDEAAENPEEATENEVTIPYGPGEPEPEGPEGQPEESLETDDYTRRLELICRLYRTRSETACDAVCDELLPELLTE